MKEALRLTIILFLTGLTIPVSDFAEDRAPDLSEYLKPFVHEISQSTYLYHYVRRERLGQVPGKPLNESDPLVRDHVASWGGYYFDSAPERFRVQGGLYLATDPMSSRDFGGGDNEWVLYRVEFPSGFKYLDQDDEFDPSRSYPWPATLRAYLKSLGCQGPAGKLDFLQHPGSPQCLKAIQEAFGKLGVNAIAYGWGAVTPVGCSSHDKAFVLVNPAALRSDSTAIFTNDASESESPGHLLERTMIKRVYTGESLYQGRRWFSFAHAPWPNLDTKRVDDAQLYAWKKEHLFECRDLVAPTAAVTQSDCARGQSSPLGEGGDGLAGPINSIAQKIQ